MIVEIITFWAIYFVCFFLAYYVADFCVMPFGVFDVYPWKCRKCLTTWSLVASYGSVALMFQSWIFFLCGVILTAGQAVCFIITDKEKGL